MRMWRRMDRDGNQFVTRSELDSTLDRFESRVIGALATCPVFLFLVTLLGANISHPKAPLKVSKAGLSWAGDVGGAAADVQHEHEQRHQKDTWPEAPAKPAAKTAATPASASPPKSAATPASESSSAAGPPTTAIANSKSNNSKCKSNNSNSNSSNSHNINRHWGGFAQDLVIVGSWCLRWCWCLLIRGSKT